MFSFLKKKLKEGIEKISKVVSEKEEKKIEEHAKEEIIEEAEKIVKEIAEEKIEEAKKVIETAKEIEKIKRPEKTEKELLKILKEKPEEKGIIEKIKKKISEKKIEEKDIKDILKELELSLISSDVAVEVAEKICNDLKNNLVGKFIKKREIEKTIKDSLRNSIFEILNIESFDLIEKIKTKKPFLIVFLGFNGSGKCVSGDTLIPLTDGSIVKIKNIYNEASKYFSETKIKDGFIIDVPSNYLNIYSVNPETLKIEQRPVTRLWKLKKSTLMKIKVENGHEIIVTPEHPFFVLKNGKIEKVSADNLDKNFYIMLPRNLVYKECRPSLINILYKLADKKIFIHSPNIKKIYDLLIERHGNLTNIWKTIKPHVSFDTFSYHWRKNNLMSSVTLLNILKIYPEFKKYIENYKCEISVNNSKKVKLPLEFGEKLGKLVGYVCGEGHLGKNYVEFTNSDNKLLLDFYKLSCKLFGCKGKIKIDKRNPNVKTYLISSVAVLMILKRLFGIPRGNKSSSMELSDFALKLPKDFWKGFLSAYTDSDGYISTNRRVIEFSTASYNFAKQLSIIFLRFGINTSFSTKIVKEKPYYRVYVLGKSKIEKFSNIVKLITKNKKERLERIKSMPAQFETSELIPNQGELIRKFRVNNNILQREIANSLGVSNTLICQNEIYDVPISRTKLMELIALTGNKEDFLSKLANSDVIWLRVDSIDKISNNVEYVYDLTVNDLHNFVADNFIVHNTTSIAKIGYLLKKNKISCVFAAGDCWRAAAIEQLEEHGKRLGIEAIKHKYGADPAAVIFDAVKHAKAKDIDVVLADTAGRSHTNVNLIDELKKIIRVNKPDLKILVLDALTGNDIYEQCKIFNDAVGVDALIVTKADVYEKGGAMLSASYTIKKPILYIGVGQNYEDLEKFSPEKIVKNLLD